MKTITDFTIDELVDYCISIKQSIEIYKELPRVREVLYEKLISIEDKDLNEFYRIIVDDILLEIERTIYINNYELIKNIIIDNHVNTVDRINKSVNRKTNNFDSAIINVQAVSNINLKNTTVFTSCNWISQSSDEHLYKFKFPWQDDYSWDKLLSKKIMVKNRFKLNTIGKFEALENRQGREIYSLLTYENCQRDIHQYLEKIVGMSGDINSITCFENTGVFQSSCFYGYVKIKKVFNGKFTKTHKRLVKKSLLSMKVRKSTIKTFKAFTPRITWFSLNLVNRNDNFNYSEIYKAKEVINKNITWFKLIRNWQVNSQNRILFYSKIESDGSITDKEVTFINCMDNRSNIRISDFYSDTEIKQKPNTLHYVVSDGNLSQCKDTSTNSFNSIPTVIGYSEQCNLL